MYQCLPELNFEIFSEIEKGFNRATNNEVIRENIITSHY